MTGTDTGIGKTIVAAALLVRYRTLRPRYWKPIQTGTEEDDDTETVRALVADGAVPLSEGVRLPAVASPHHAAHLAGCRIDLEPLLAIARAQSNTERFVVEGAGGVLVPINESALMVDFIRALGLPALVVARSTLGTINHTLLTLEALRARGIAVAGVVLNGPPSVSNREAIETYGAIGIMGEIPRFDCIDAAAVARIAESLDPSGRLMEPALA